MSYLHDGREQINPVIMMLKGDVNMLIKIDSASATLYRLMYVQMRIKRQGVQ